MDDLAIRHAANELRAAWREAQASRGESWEAQAITALAMHSDHLIYLKERLQ